MANIAEIGFEADTSDLVTANAELGKMPVNAGKAETASDRLVATMMRLTSAMESNVGKVARGRTANDNLAKSTVRLETAMQGLHRATGINKTSAAALGATYSALGAETDRLRAKYAPLSNVVTQYRKNLTELRRAYKMGAISSDEFSAALSRQRNAAEVARQSILNSDQALARMTKGAGLARHNVGNLAAQFQDIGVTAAMGMNPMMVAFQQGTQISAVLAMEARGAGGAFKFLAAALGSVLSPMAIGTIAFVALAVALIQLVDWADLAVNSLNFIADVLPSVAKYSVLAAAGLALMYAPTILKGAARLPGLVLALSKRLWGVAAALYATVGLPVLLLAGFVAIVAAANVFRDDLTRIFGFDIVDAAKRGVNFIIGVFVGGYKAIVKTWSLLPFVFEDIATQAVNNALKKVMEFTNKTRTILNALPGVTIPILPEKVDLIKNRFEGAAKAVGQTISSEIRNAVNADYIGEASKAIENGANKLSNKLRGLAKGIGADSDGIDKFKKIVSGSQSESASVRAEIKGLNMTASAARNLKNETDLLNKARNAGIKLTPQQTAQLKELAATLSALQDTLDGGQFFKDMNTSMTANTVALQAEKAAIGLVGVELEQHKAKTELLATIKAADITLTNAQTTALLKQADAVAALRAQNANDTYFADKSKSMKEALLDSRTEIQALGMTKKAAAALRFERKLLNDEMFRGIQLSPQQTKALKAEAAALFDSQQQYIEMKEKMDFAKSTTKDFFKEIQQGIVKGKNLFKTFADSVVGALNKILDKMLDKALDQAIDDLFNPRQNGGGAGAGGGAGGLGSLFSGLFGGMNTGNQTGAVSTTPSTTGTSPASGMLGSLGGGAGAGGGIIGMLLGGGAVAGILGSLGGGGMGGIIGTLFGGVGGGLISNILSGVGGGGMGGIIGTLFGGVGGGLISKLLGGSSKGGLIAGLFGGGAMSGIKKLFGFAKGGSFDGGLQKFAKGGAFTNSVVNSPTLFKFAKGTGLMGEAGPEAIMPLKRGSDGSLGVQMHGGNTGGGGANVANMNFTTHQHVSGAVSSQDIMALMKQQSEQTQQETRRSVLAWLQQQQVDGAVV